MSVVASFIFYAVVCLGSSVKVADTNKLDKSITRAGSVLGMGLDPLRTVAETLSTLLSILDSLFPPSICICACPALSFFY